MGLIEAYVAQAKKRAQSSFLPTEALLEQVLPHFAGVEAGEEVTVQQVWDNYQSATPTAEQALCTNLALLPSLAQLEEQIGALKNHKAPGSDGLFHELFKVDQAKAAKLWFGLLFKASGAWHPASASNCRGFAPIMEGQGDQR